MYLPEMRVLPYLTSLMLDSGSSAVRVRVTEVVFVYMSPSLISTDPVGGVLSFAPLTSNKSALKNEVREKSSNRIRAINESFLLPILQPLIKTELKTANITYVAIFYTRELSAREDIQCSLVKRVDENEKNIDSDIWCNVVAVDVFNACI
jgi:hypothetical protein